MLNLPPRPTSTVVRAHFPSSQRQRALVNMCFQMGTQGLAKFRKMVAAIMRDDWATAQAEALDSKWARSDSPARAQRVAHMLGRGA